MGLHLFKANGPLIEGQPTCAVDRIRLSRSADHTVKNG
eukprot:COSAG06_NODE_68_length_26072_cov_68.140377_2_plen_38_part_00